MLLGARLRRLRQARGVGRDDAGYAIRASESKISRMELGRVGFKERDVADLLTLYGVVDNKTRAALLALANEANRPGWWHPYADLLSSWSQYYMDLESAATLIRTYEAQLVPGLLQTAAYARAAVLLRHGDIDDEEVDRRVDLQVARQQLLTRPDPPQVWAVVDEAVLRKPIGGADVMRAQLRHLIQVSSLPNVNLQVVSIQAGGHAAPVGAFAILRFPEQNLPDVVYLEHLTGALFLDRREDVDHYAATIAKLYMAAAPVARTREVLQRALRDLDAA
ncbi:MAG TPA: DUF5753 domain-containing protein [Pilimelia sp.]|nr:DUF5753 domain-containing protein [Pilimelia sp.]